MVQSNGTNNSVKNTPEQSLIAQEHYSPGESTKMNYKMSVSRTKTGTERETA